MVIMMKRLLALGTNTISRTRTPNQTCWRGAQMSDCVGDLDNDDLGPEPVFGFRDGHSLNRRRDTWLWRCDTKNRFWCIWSYYLWDQLAHRADHMSSMYAFQPCCGLNWSQVFLRQSDFSLYGDLVAWFTHTRQVVAAVYTEAEYIAFADAYKDTLGALLIIERVIAGWRSHADSCG